MTGVTTANLPATSLADSVLVNRDGSTAQMDINLLAAQIAVETPGPRYPTRAALYADLAWPVDAQGIVWGDVTEAYRGLYRKSGASGAGSWARYADLPLSTVSLSLLDAKAPLASPALTGTPTVPTAAQGTATDQIASTAFVRGAVDLAAGILTSQLAADVELQGAADAVLADRIDAEIAARTAADALRAPLASPALTGVPTGPTAAAGTNTTQLATTAFVDAVRVILAAADTAEASARAAADTTLTNALALKAALASPALTGTPTAPTASAGTTTTQIATTAFVKAALDALVAAAPGAIDTLNELAVALGNDPAFATTMTNALATKASTAALAAETAARAAHEARADNPHAVTKAQVGLGAVDNVAAAALRDRATHTGTQDMATLTETEGRKILTSAERSRLAVLQGRDSLGEFTLAVRDPAGRVAGFDAAGRAVAAGLDLRQSLDRDALTEATTLVSSATGAPVLQFDAAGRLAGEYASAPAATTRDALREAEPVIKAQGGTSLIVGREDGLDIAHSAAWRDRLAAELVTLAPAFDRTGRRAFHLRQTASHLVAATQLADGYAGDIMQVPGRTTAIPYSPAPLVALHVTGQSNAGAGPGPVGTPPVTGVLAQDHILRTDVDDYSSGSTEEVPGAATDFVSASEPRLANQAQSPAAMQAYGIWMLGRRAGRECPGILLSTAWQGGQTIDKFFPGAYPAVSGSESPLYENLYAHVVNAARVADQAYGRAVEHNIVWVQGEGDTDYASYLSQMQLWLSTVLPTFDAITSGAVRPHFFLFQTQTGTAAEVAETGSGAAQLKVARDNLGAGVTMIGPMYQGAVHDNIHHDNLARMMMGELMALAHEWVRVKATPFNPLWPVAGGVTRSGATITIPMVLPPGTTALSFDADWVAAIANKGFWYADDSGSPPAISNVAISGSNIVITLAAVPGGANKRVGYGTKKLTETPGWASSRGQLYADSGLRSPYAALGHAVPQTIRHYCVRFMETLA